MIPYRSLCSCLAGRRFLSCLLFKLSLLLLIRSIDFILIVNALHIPAIRIKIPLAQLKQAVP